MAAHRAQSPERRVTLEEFERLPEDGFRYELSRGRLVREPQPLAEHGVVAENMAAALRRYLDRHASGRSSSRPASC